MLPPLPFDADACEISIALCRAAALNFALVRLENCACRATTLNFALSNARGSPGTGG